MGLASATPLLLVTTAMGPLADRLGRRAPAMLSCSGEVDPLATLALDLS